MSAETPAGRLRERLTEGKGRLLVVAATSTVWLMDLLLVHRLEDHQEIGLGVRQLVTHFERTGSAVFIVSPGLRKRPCFSP